MCARQSAAAAVVIVLALGGCSGGRTFTASEFTEKVTEQGVSIQLGRRLSSTDENLKLYAVTLPPLPGEPPPAPGTEGAPGASGSLYEYPDTGSAEDETRACRGSGGLLCYQAENIVIVLESDGLAAQRLAVAIRKMAD